MSNTTKLTSEYKWLNVFHADSPSRVVKLFGQSANGFNPGYDIRILELQLRYYSEHATQSAVRVRVYRYDAGATTDRLILSVSETDAAVGYRVLTDDTPDTSYYDLDSAAGDTIWIDIDDGSASAATRVSDLSISVKYREL